MNFRRLTGFICTSWLTTGTDRTNLGDNNLKYAICYPSLLKKSLDRENLTLCRQACFFTEILRQSCKCWLNQTRFSVQKQIASYFSCGKIGPGHLICRSEIEPFYEKIYFTGKLITVNPLNRTCFISFSVLNHHSKQKG